jgi:hypothetical protein
MEPLRAFERAFSRYGGPLRAGNGPLSADAFEEAKSWYNLLLDRGVVAAPPTYPTRGIYVDYVNNDAFNAAATQLGEQELIGIFGGTSLLWRYWLALFADGTRWPHVWDGARDHDNLKPRSASALLIEQARPTDSTRLTAALNLAWIGAIFLFAHEMAHLTHGHLHLLRKSFGSVNYEELPFHRLSAEEAVVRRALEMDADCTAAAGSWAFLREFHSAGHLPALDNVKPSIAWGAAIFMLFCIISAASSKVAGEHSSHPTPFQRAVYISQLPGYRHEYGAPPDFDDVFAGVGFVQQWWQDAGLERVMSGDACEPSSDSLLNDLNKLAHARSNLLPLITEMADTRAEAIRARAGRGNGLTIV